jgi:rRNA-processing protein EBP2
MLTGDGENNVNDDEFDVAVENAISDNNLRPNKKAKMSRQARDSKFGFGKGPGRFSKQNTRESTDTFGGPGKGKGKRTGGAKKAQRPGKSKRMNARNK